MTTLRQILKTITSINALLLSGCLLLPVAHAATTANLVINGDAENGTIGWTVVSGLPQSIDAGVNGGFAAAQGGFYFAGQGFGGGTSPGTTLDTMSQTIDVSGMAADIALGTVTFDLTAQQTTWNGSDVPVLELEAFDATDVSLGVWNLTNNTSQTWTPVATTNNVPATTDYFILTVGADHNAGTDNDGYTDDISLTLTTPDFMCESFRDTFNPTNYGNQSGTLMWSANWIETGDDGAANNGDIRINGGRLRLEGDGAGGGRPAFGGNPSIEREADLSAYTSAVLTFDYSESGNWEADDEIEVWISADGGANWTLLNTFVDDQSGTQQFFANITDYRATNTRIAFVEKADGNNEVFWIDNVNIEACVGTDEPVVEAGRVTLNDTTINPNPVNVCFATPFATPPAVFSLLGDEGPDPIALRIDNVTTNGFSVVQVESVGSGVGSAAHTIDFVAIEQGQYQLAGGVQMEVGAFNITRHQGRRVAGAGWFDANFNDAFDAAPALVTALQTMNNEIATPPATSSVPFLSTAVRDVRTDDFDLALERAETVGANTNIAETVAYLAIDAGKQGRLNDQFEFESIYSAQNISGWQNGCFGTNFSGAYTANPLVVGSQATRNGSDGGWLRRCNLNTNQIGLTIDEDIDNDGERAHIAERAGLLLLKGTAADYTNSCTTDVHHYAISHSGNAVTCEAETVKISAHDALDVLVVPSNTTTITLSTSVPVDGWALKSGGGTFDPINNQYTFDGIETEVEFWLTRTTPTATAPDEPIDIDVSDGVSTDIDGDPTEDKPLAFVDSAFRFYTGGGPGVGINNTIGTQIAGKASNINPNSQSLFLAAVEKDTDTGACKAALTDATDDLPVKIAFECKNPNTCQRPLFMGKTTASTAITGTNTDVANPLNYTDVLLDFGTEGEAPFVINYPDAGQIKLHAEYTTANGKVLTGASNDFVSRPFGFHVEAIDNPAAADHNGTEYRKAGMPFQVNVTAALWKAVDDSDNNGIPNNHDDNNPGNNVDLSDNSVTLGTTTFTGVPNFGQEGEEVDIEAILIGPFVSAYADSDFPVKTLASFTAGADNTTTASFNDVGIIELRAKINDNDYLGIGATESSRMISKSGYVGRFLPDSFRVSVTEKGELEHTCTAGLFSYIGEDLDYGIKPTFTVTALNALATPTTTQNYRGDYMKLAANSITVEVDKDKDTSNLGTDGNLLDIVYTPSTMTFASQNNGTVNYVFGADKFRYGVATGLAHIKAANSEVAPFDADIDPGITEIRDSDNVSTTFATPVTFDLDSGPLKHQQRFGRIRMSNAFGSELLDLDMPMIIEYFTGSFYQINVDDSCTTFDDADVLIVADNLSTAGTSTISVTNPMAISGNLGVTLTAPGAGITGSIDLSGLLAGPLTGVIENKWLRYNWDNGTEFDDDPSATATFGIYKGNDVNIYIQQTYQ